jgi:hypothetical protein
LIFMDILKIKSQIKSPYFNMILKISKSSQNDLKSDFVKSSIKSLNTLLFARFLLLRFSLAVFSAKNYSKILNKRAPFIFLIALW